MIRPFMSSDGSSTTRDRRLGRVARRDALQRVGDEVARAPLRLGARLLLEHPDAAREVVPDELLAPLEQVRLRLLERHAGDALERLLLRRLRLLHLLLELAQVRLAVGEPLVLAAELEQLPLDLLLLREHALLDLQDRLAPVGELLVDLGPERHGLLARLDLRLAPHGLGLALGVLDELAVQAPRLADPRRAEDLHGDEREDEPDGDPDGDSDSDQHVPGTSLGWGSRPTRHRARSRGSPEHRFRIRRPRSTRTPPRTAALSGREPPAPTDGTGCRGFGHGVAISFGKAQFAGKMSGEAIPDPSAVRPRPQIRRGRSSVEASKPRAASQRSVFRPPPRRSSRPRARSASGSSAARPASHRARRSSPSPSRA